MKVAVCISGGIRYPHIGLESLKNIIPNEDIKVFIHTWKINDREEFVKTIYDVKNKEEDKTVDTDVSFVEQNYTYESLLVEDYDSKQNYFHDIFSSLEFSEYLRTDVGPISMHYSIYRSNDLKRKYEELHRMTFDRVIRMRFDSNFKGKNLVLDDLNSNVCIPAGDDWCDGINDQFALGTSHGMDLYSNVFWNYHNLQKIGDSKYHPESILKNHLDFYGIIPQRFDFQVQINNGIDWKRVVFGNT